MKLKGFTLPELFCTMLILSILCFLFWQTIYPVYTKMVASRKIKKFYSVMKQVKFKAQAANIDWLDYFYDPGNYSAKDFSEDYILPYITYIKSDTSRSDEAKIILNDALSFKVKKNSSLCLDFILDINDDKSPNEPGKDIFYFTYCPEIDTSFYKQGEIIPYILKNEGSRTEVKNKCLNEPEYCSGLVAIDDFSFENDYPFRLPL